eukprot:TRINITY_DN14578_c0_g1_i1.p1 TRINITY_DN14578_c0_g1~~TRINITY_DN14578_c0_g1_i1.p1  ORF type:complete len:519 (-),score=104.90 TRINITY_DN14578_c0_g1_i1:2-1558(-)
MEKDKIRKSVEMIVHDLLHVTPEHHQKDMSEYLEGKLTFEEMGVDSLSVMRLSNVLSHTFHVSVTSEDLYLYHYEHLLGRILCRSPTMEEDTLSVIMKDTSSLPLHITANPTTGGNVKLTNVNPSIPSKWPHVKIFLTGCTGFVGSFLLYQLLCFHPTSSVYCLMRHGLKKEQNSNNPLETKLKQVLEEYHLWDSFMKSNWCRVVIVPGDIEKKGLGVEFEILKNSEEEIDVIYHCAADVNHALPYHLLRETNVLGTINVLEFSSTKKLKLFNFFSSVSIGDHHPDSFSNISFLGGYTRSKWVAEKLVRIGRSRGIPTNIFRLGLVSWVREGLSGDARGGKKSGLGAFNKRDWLSCLLAGIKALGFYPPSSSKINFIPVDDVAKILTHLGCSDPFQATFCDFVVANEECLSFQGLMGSLSNELLHHHHHLRPCGSHVQWNDLVMQAIDTCESNVKLRWFHHLQLYPQSFPSDEDVNYHVESTILALKASTESCDDLFEFFRARELLKGPGFQVFAKFL